MSPNINGAPNKYGLYLRMAMRRPKSNKVLRGLGGRTKPTKSRVDGRMNGVN